MSHALFDFAPSALRSERTGFLTGFQNHPDCSLRMPGVLRVSGFVGRLVR
jgi:hypothetical protein